MNRLEVGRTDTGEIAILVCASSDERDATMVLGLSDSDLLGFASDIIAECQANLVSEQESEAPEQCTNEGHCKPSPAAPKTYARPPRYDEVFFDGLNSLDEDASLLPSKGAPKVDVRIDADELAAMRAELKRLKAREQELLESNTRLVFERRGAMSFYNAACENSFYLHDRSRRLNIINFARIALQEVPTAPMVPSDEVVRLRYRLMAEEFFESVFAAFDKSIHWGIGQVQESLMRIVNESPIRIDMEAVADGLIDTAYTVEGALVSFGINGDALWKVVHDNNMTKDGGHFINGKLCKPPTWVPPDIRGELIRQGWRGAQ